MFPKGSISYQNDELKRPLILTKTANTTPRVTAIDALRGAVMIVMALDHTRDFFHAGAMSFQPEDLARTTPLPFFTRWITHVCAPAFMLLAGMGAFLRLHRDGSTARLSRFLWTRGLWLIVIELTVMRLAMNFTLDTPYPVLVLVLSALGLSMIALSALIYLPMSALAVVSLMLISFHNLLDGIDASRFGDFAGLWRICLHQPGPHARRRAHRRRLPGAPMDRRHGRRLLPGPGAAPRGSATEKGAGGHGDRAPLAVRRSACRERLRRPGCVVQAGSRDVHGALVPQDDEVSAVARVPADDPGSRAACAGGLRQAAARAGPSSRGDRPRAVLLLRRALLGSSRSGLADGVSPIRAASAGFLFSPLPSMGGSAERFPPDFGYSLWITYVVWMGVVVLLYPLCRRVARAKARTSAWWASYV